MLLARSSQTLLSLLGIVWMLTDAECWSLSVRSTITTYRVFVAGRSHSTTHRQVPSSRADRVTAIFLKFR